MFDASKKMLFFSHLPAMLAIFSTIAGISIIIPESIAFSPQTSHFKEPPPIQRSTPTNRKYSLLWDAKQTATETPTKSKFFTSLDKPYDLNGRSETRTKIVNDLIEEGSLPGGGSLPNPGSQESFAQVAPGVWRVVYAPHMTTMAGIFRGEFSVQYDLREDGTMTSHAKYNFPLFHLWGYLSVSGTYGSVNDKVCRVDFDEAWIRTFDEEGDFEIGPYPDIDSVQESLFKQVIRNVGKALFIEPFAVFPVSYLDNDLIVFDFELLGTRICARKEM